MKNKFISMRNLTFFIGSWVLAAGFQLVVQAQDVPGQELIGRWDITVDVGGKPAPSWLEVKRSGTRTLVGYYVSTEGSARPVSEVTFENGKFGFSIPPQWESGGGDLTVSAQLTGQTITGTVTKPDGKSYPLKGVRAPDLKRAGVPTWGTPIELFNGRDLTGWKASGTNQWEIRDGVLTSPKPGSNLITEQKFDDFKLHVEFRYPAGSNSGLYLRGRYEVQIMDTPREEHPSNVLYGGVYGFLTPSEIAAKEPGEWQTYEIAFIGRMVTIVANGKTVISNQEIPGITGGALDSNEGEPGPIYLQGDHGPVEFRKITITPAK